MAGVSSAIIGGSMLAGSLISSRSQEKSAERAANQAAEAARPVPISTPLYYTNVRPDGRVTSSLTGQGQGLLSGALGDYRSIPLSSITQPGFTYGQSDRDLLGRAEQMYGRADQFFDRSGATFDRSGQFFDQANNTFGRVGGFLDRSANTLDRATPYFDRADTYFDRADVAFNRAQTPEASLSFLERAFGPQLAQARAAQENRLFNQGLLGSTTGSLQTEALSRGQQGALLEGALQQQQFQGQLGQALSGVGTNVGNLGTNIGALGINQGNLGINLGNLGVSQGNLGATIGNLGVNQAAVGQGLLGSALNARQLYSNINLGRQSQDLAERQFLNQARSGSLAAALGLLEAPGGGVATTLGGQGNAGAAAQAAAIGAQGAAQRQNAIMSGITAAGLGLLGMQQPTQTAQTMQYTQPNTNALIQGSFIGSGASPSFTQAPSGYSFNQNPSTGPSFLFNQ